MVGGVLRTGRTRARSSRSERALAVAFEKHEKSGP